MENENAIQFIVNYYYWKVEKAGESSPRFIYHSGSVVRTADGNRLKFNPLLANIPTKYEHKMYNAMLSEGWVGLPDYGSYIKKYPGRIAVFCQGEKRPTF